MTISNSDRLKDEGLSLFNRGAYYPALDKFQSAMEGYNMEENQLGQAEMLNNIGVIYRLQGNFQDALSSLAQAEAIFARLDQYNQQAQALGNLGDLHTAGQDKDKAAVYYSNSAELFAKDGDGEKQSQVLRALSLMRLRQGRFLEAMMHMERSLAVRPRPGLSQRLFRSLLRFALRLLSNP